MSIAPTRKSDLKRRAKHELIEYLAMAGFLAVFMVSLTTYRMLILAEYHISYFEYGWALTKALILAKVVLIGEAMHVGEGFRVRPLIWNTLWKTLTFSLFVAAFAVVEHLVAALIHHRPLAEEFHLGGGHGYELLARVQLEAVAFLPFFAFRELSRVMGEREIVDLFLHGEAPPQAASK